LILRELAGLVAESPEFFLDCGDFIKAARFLLGLQGRACFDGMRRKDVVAGEIRAQQAYYIKLGSGGEWEQECIRKTQTLRFGYREIPHDLCASGRWADVKTSLVEMRADKGAATRDLTQIRAFYEAGDDVLWVTFHGNYLWWCFSKRLLRVLADGSKERPAIGAWSSSDVRRRPLSMDRLRGSLLAMQAYRGTICAVREFEYLLNKLNGLTPKAVEEAQTALKNLTDKIEHLIRGLHPADFELLIDLMFRETGWKRVGQLGKTQKDIDLELVSPVTNEKMMVQVKSQSGPAEFKEYKERFATLGGYSKGYFIVHTPDKALESMEPGEDDLRYLGPKQVAKLCVDYGLADWLISKAE
jgi:hypothetical protein